MRVEKALRYQYGRPRQPLFRGAVSEIVEPEINRMKRKAPMRQERPVPPEMLERARRAISEDRLKLSAKCSVCGAETSCLADDEPLCWVCRRLKISAWRDNEQPAPPPE